MNKLNHPYFSFAITLLICLLALLSTIFLNYSFLFEFVDEGGLIESLTLFFYFFAALFALFYPKSHIKISSRIAIAILMLTMLAREADLHKILGMSMLKIKFWLSNESSISDKLIAAIILLFVLTALILLLKNSLKSWKEDLQHKSVYAITIVLFFGVLVTSKILDRSLNMIYEISGWEAPIWLVALQLPLEEYLECLLPLLVIIAIIQYGHQQSHLIKK